MQATLLPKTVCHKMDAMLHDFWWGKLGAKGTSLNLKSWDNICLSKSVGGLGLSQQIFEVWLIPLCFSERARVLCLEEYLPHNPLTLPRCLQATREWVLPQHLAGPRVPSIQNFQPTPRIAPGTGAT
ncbi:hypothetical protein TIFTF001_046586 [Ficus carica]|uniref:Uncharacterized protein n=1 Tax=Ficus carica TaxID=3494 RepID=A0AA88CUI2_FICCA|nr:hypothetical protein TIFTF001_046586 [Ficus carica]